MNELIEKFKQSFEKDFGVPPHMDVVRLWVDQSLNDKMKEYVESYLCDRNEADLVKLTKALRGEYATDVKPDIGTEKVYNGSKKPQKRKP